SFENALIVPAGQQSGTSQANIAAFAPPAPYTPGNAGRNILTGPAAYFSQMAVKKNFRITERVNLQFRYDFQNPFHNFAFSPPTHSVDFKNRQLLCKITSDVPTANICGQPPMRIALQLTRSD